MTGSILVIRPKRRSRSEASQFGEIDTGSNTVILGRVMNHAFLRIAV